MSATNTVARRCCPYCGGDLRVERFYFDKASRTIIGNGHVRQLTPHESSLFETLWPPAVSFKTSTTLAGVLGANFYRSPHGGIPAIAARAKRLRRVLAPMGIILEGCRARDRGGYRIVVPRPAKEKK